MPRTKPDANALTIQIADAILSIAYDYPHLSETDNYPATVIPHAKLAALFPDYADGQSVGQAEFVEGARAAGFIPKRDPDDDQGISYRYVKRG